ncbi:MAG: thioredoxin family protein [Flavobacteriales bacterium]|nr:thioredoxin family protein [Flavobacteriales bacterium]
MRTSLLALVLLPLALLAQDPHAGQKIKWMTFDQAMAAAKKDGKPLFIDVYTQWCGPCKMLSGRTFMDDQLAAYVNEHFHAVKFDAEGNEKVTYKGKSYGNPNFNPQAVGGRNGTHDLTMLIAPVEGRVAYPTIVYMDKDGNVLAPVQGFMTPEQMEPILIYFGEGKHKTMDWPTFSKDFKSRRTPVGQ